MIPAQPDPPVHQQLVRYLLDELNETACDEIEIRLLKDAEFQEQLAVAELEVAELFEKRLLKPDQMKLVRSKFGANPSWKQNLYFCRVMAAEEAKWSAPRLSRAKSGIFRTALLSGALISLAVALAVWFVLHPSVHSTVEIGKRSNVSVAVLLPPPLKGLERQVDNTVSLPQAPGPVELRMVLRNDFYPEYEVRLRSVSTGVEQSLGTVKPDRPTGGQHTLRVGLDSSQLSPGRYTIVLRALERDGSVVNVGGYSFRAVIGSGNR
jgi:hypothetical protein